MPAKGVERWLSQSLAGVLGAVDGDGVAARICFPSPTQLVEQAFCAASGVAVEDDPWSASRVLWALLDLLDEVRGQPWCPVLTQHLGDGTDSYREGRRYATAEHLQRLFRSYSAHRPPMLLDWARGRDTDGLGPLPRDLVWQAELWRRLRASLGASSPAERLAETCARLGAEPWCSTLPSRLHLFGATRLTAEQRAVLAALGQGREVHLWLPHPSPAMWDTLRAAPRPARRRDDSSALLLRHPLLATLSRDTRELQLLLDDVPDEHHAGAAPAADAAGPPAGVVCTPTRRRSPAPRPTAPCGCTPATGRRVRSRCCASCCSGCSQDDPTLEPRDVLVMCPDVETYAPLVRGRLRPARRRASRPPAAGAAGRPGARADQPAAGPAVHAADAGRGPRDGGAGARPGRQPAGAPGLRLQRRRPRADARLGRARPVSAGGSDRPARAHRLGGIPQNTWATGLDRLLARRGGRRGRARLARHRAAARRRRQQRHRPRRPAGRAACERFDAILAELRTRTPSRPGCDVLGEAFDLLAAVADPTPGSSRRRAPSSPRLPSTAVRHRCDWRTCGRCWRHVCPAGPTRANFRTGDLTVCTMVPMRSVPHRVVVPARARRRRVPAARAPTATTSSQPRPAAR